MQRNSIAFLRGFETFSTTLPLDPLLCFGTLIALTGTAVLVVCYLRKWQSPRWVYTLWLVAFCLSALWSWWLAGGSLTFSLMLCGTLVGTGFTVWRIPLLSPFGRGLFAVKLASTLCISLWGYQLLETIGWSSGVQIFILLFIIPLATLLFCQGTTSQIIHLSRMTLKAPRYQAAVQFLASDQGEYRPKISIHVPCYAEPPELLIETLEALSRLDYDNFEVLVIDNNTKDPGLWKPVQSYCERLDKRFRFFHVDPLSGAKAGALNFALRHIAADAEFIAVVDADYIADRDFLKRWIPLFQEDRLGFVQTTHEYRDWEGNCFLSRFYGGYVLTHKMKYPAMSEFGAAVIVGTMCIIRRRALEETGGWAEWCLTEDSEMSVRLQSLGYDGYFFAEPSGRGLMPLTLDRIRQQLYRWAYGPPQYMKRHIALYLGLSHHGRLTLAQKIFHLQGGLEFLPYIVKPLMFIPLFPIAYREITLGSEYHLGLDLCAFLLSQTVSDFVESWIALKLIGQSRFLDVCSLKLTVFAAVLPRIRALIHSLIGLKLHWRRTNKFGTSPNLFRAISTTWLEMLLAGACLVGACLLNQHAKFAPLNISALLMLLLAMRMFQFLSVVAIGMLCEFELWTKERLARRPSIMTSELQ
jgi:cellulose synthase/poly-beta-1,6-N-acetylglucosamine synthase-like glycosyltransferase